MCRSIRLCLLALVVYVEGGAVAKPEEKSPIFETVHTSNAALFNRLGLSPLRISQGHHKKRLAGPEPPLNFASQNHQAYGRRHGHRDSHVYIVKLPPSLPYYAITRPHKESRNEVTGGKNDQNFPVGFQSNGKPGGIYHWNLPVMKKIAEKKRLVEHRLQVQQKLNQAQNARIEDPSNEVGGLTSSTPKSKDEGKTEKPLNLVVGMGNDVTIGEKRMRNNDKRLNYGGEGAPGLAGKQTKPKNSNKNYRLEDSLVYKIKPAHNEHRLNWNGLADQQNTMFANAQKQKKHRKKSATSYYAPFSLKSGSTNLHKNFSGNGKPKAFYVIEKSRKPVYYHPLLP